MPHPKLGAPHLACPIGPAPRQSRREPHLLRAFESRGRVQRPPGCVASFGHTFQKIGLFVSSRCSSHPPGEGRPHSPEQWSEACCRRAHFSCNAVPCGVIRRTPRATAGPMPHGSHRSKLLINQLLPPTARQPFLPFEKDYHVMASLSARFRLPRRRVWRVRCSPKWEYGSTGALDVRMEPPLPWECPMSPAPITLEPWL